MQETEDLQERKDQVGPCRDGETTGSLHRKNNLNKNAQEQQATGLKYDEVEEDRIKPIVTSSEERLLDDWILAAHRK